MLTYITAFIFYTMAMIGVLLVGFIVYKKAMQSNKSLNKNMIKVLDSVVIAPKKILYVIKVKNEKFLIAGDCENTTFLSKLTDNDQKQVVAEEKNNNNQKQFKHLYTAPQTTSDRKEMIKNLLKDLNGASTLQGSEY